MIDPTEHWLAIHSYPTIHWTNWDRFEAETFTRQWIADIDRLDIEGCKCSAKFKIVLMHHPVLYVSPKWFAIWSFRAHNYVNFLLAKPQLEIDQAAKLYGWLLQ